MRFSTIFSVFALTAAVPALAAPVVSGPQYAKRDSNNARDFTTPLEVKRDIVESRSFAPFPRPPRFPFPFPPFPKPPFPKGPFPKFPGNGPIAVARADDFDESGAINWGRVWSWAKPVIKTVAGFLKREDIDDLLSRGDDELVAREFEQHIARELFARDDLESGAINWGRVWNWAKPVIKTVAGFLKREDIDDLLSRGDDELVAREFEQHVARELLAREDPESGAFWGTVFRWAPTIIKAVSGLINKREMEGLAARGFEDVFANELRENFARGLLAREDPESGAFWGTVFRWAPTIIKAVSGLINKREMEELLARSAVETRSLNELD